MKNRLLFVLSVLFICFSCNEEADIIASEGNENYVNLDSVKNQGSKIYTDRLVAYFDNYKILTLYSFPVVQFQYEITQNAAFDYQPADEAYVGDMLDILDELFYEQLGNKAINAYAPRNVLLVSQLRDTLSTDVRPFVDCYMGMFNLTFSGTDEQVTTWNKERKQQFKDKVLTDYVTRIFKRGLEKIPEAFISVSKYGNAAVNSSNYGKYGFLYYHSGIKTDYRLDFYSYITAIISNTTDSFTANYLDSSIDEDGLILKKYNIVLSFMNACGIDMKKIADYEIR